MNPTKIPPREEHFNLNLHPVTSEFVTESRDWIFLDPHNSYFEVRGGGDVAPSPLFTTLALPAPVK